MAMGEPGGEACWTQCGPDVIFSQDWQSGAIPPATPIVLVHGLVISGRYLARLAERLAPFGPVFVPDLPGHGRSAKPSHAYSVPELADALVAWLDARGLGTVSLLGHSFGCQVVAAAAARRPDRINNVVLAAPAVAPEQRAPLVVTACWLRNVPREPLSLFPIILHDAGRMGPRLALEEFRTMLSSHLEDSLPGVRAPALVIRGQHDTTATLRWCEEVVARLPDARLAEIPRVAHAVNYAASEATASVVRAFMAGRCPSRVARAR